MVQSVHMFEQVLQLIQVTVWNVPDNEALGLLGYVFQAAGHLLVLRSKPNGRAGDQRADRVQPIT